MVASVEQLSGRERRLLRNGTGEWPQDWRELEVLNLNEDGPSRLNY